MFIQATVKSTPRNSSGQFIASRVTPAIRAGVKAYVQVAYDESQILVRVKTGRLKASGTESPFEQDEAGGIRITETDRSVRADIVYTAPYASFVEFRFPFLRSGLDAAREAGYALFKSNATAAMKP